MVWYKFIKQLTVSYWATIGISALFVVAIIALLFFEKEKIRRYTYLWYTALVLVFIYNPVTLLVSRHILEASTFEQYYLRFFSLAPIVFVMAGGMTHIINKFSGVKKLIAVGGVLVVVALCGNLLYNEEWFTKAENRNKVPQDVVTICDIFADESGPINIMVPQDIAVYLRQMDAKFAMPYARYVDDEAYELTNENPQVQIVVSYCKRNRIDYVVVSKNPLVVNSYLNYGFELVGWTNEYAVLSVMDNPSWILTEYNQASGDQGLFYTMTSRKTGKLIVIDGGDAANEAQVRQAINNNGGVVDAWIVTHYHQDHCTVFNSIYADPQGIEIKEIYATDLDAQYFHSVAQEWDDVDTYDLFMEQTVDASNLHFVNRDDVLIFDDLTITFFNACDDVVYNNREDVPNNDSLVFKMATEQRSILICSDCHSKGMAEYLVNTYGKTLQSDILQCGHHGNNSMPIETGFYEVVNPSIAIFDAPDWVMQGEQYTAKDLKEYLEENGVRTVSFESAPNVFGF